MRDNDDPLRGYRPAGPPPGLRARIVREAEGARAPSLREWLPAIATAALIGLLYIAATGIRARVYSQLIDPADVPEVEVLSP
jgi:hypothetical protein